MNSVADLFKRDRATPVTLDTLWAEAERLGYPELKLDAYEKVYKAEIRLRSSSSTIWMKHTDSCHLAALAGAIEKARAVMAVTQGN